MGVSRLPAGLHTALMALVALASREDCCGRPVRLAEIAGEKLSQAYLEQLFGRLRRAGLVASARGPGGGYKLARPPAAVRLADVVRAMEEDEAGAACVCPRSHALWQALDAHLEVFLCRVTLDDVVHQRMPPTIGTQDRAGDGA